MKFFGLIVFAVMSIANAEVVEDHVNLGKQDSRGAYQEVTFKPFNLTLEYFDEITQTELLSDKSLQEKYNLFNHTQYSFWGHFTFIFFQDGELKSRNRKTTSYKILDEKKAFCYVAAVVSFDNLEQLKKGIYTVSGTVTLVAGSSHYGPVNSSGGADPNFSQGIMLNYQQSGAYNYKPGTPFNQWGNGKDDQGRIYQVGCESFQVDDKLTVGLLKKAAGSLVDIIYP